MSEATHAEQAEWCRLARSGDRAAYDRLALSVWPWCRRKARTYARGDDTDDLEAAALALLPAVVAGYDPGRGTFLGYFASAASREMLSFVRREAARPDRAAGGGGAGVLPDRHASRAAGADALAAAVADLDPIARALWGYVHGPGRVGMRRARRILGLKPARARAVYRAAFDRLSDALAQADWGAELPHP